MRNKNKLKEIYVKDCACYYFDDIITGTDINFTDILLGNKLYENISVYGILHEILMASKSLSISFNETGGFMMVLDGKIKHLVVFDYGLFDKIGNTIKYLISKKSGITNNISHNFGRITIDSNSYLAIKETLIFHFS